MVIRIPDEYSTIQEGIDHSSDGDTVLVSEGTYHELINFLGKNILLASAYLFTSDTTSIAQTIIDGDSSYTGGGSVVSFTSSEDSLVMICGFTIRKGIGTYVNDGYSEGYRGGGIYSLNASPKIINNIIQNNTVDARPIEGSIADGGGIYAYGGSPRIVRNRIVNNIALGYEWFQTTGRGGGICLRSCYNQKILIRGNVIEQNEAGLQGAGVFVEDVWGEIFNNEISFNRTSPGLECMTYIWGALPISIHNNRIMENGLSGISLWDGYSADITQNIIAFNQGGDGIDSFTYLYSLIQNNTIVGNGYYAEYSFYGCGIYLEYNATEIRNNIIALNRKYGLKSYSDDPWEVSNYNDVWGNQAGQYYGVQAGPRDISSDPKFEDLVNANLSLSASSPCIDAGDWQSGVPEGGGDRIDIGAYEYPQLYNGVLSYLAHSDNIEPGKPYVLPFHLTNPLGEPIVVDAWIEFSGPMCGVAKKFLNVTIPPGESTGTLNISIPGWLTPGYYTLKGRLGIFGEEIWDSEIDDLVVIPAPKKYKTVW
jgi:hypothetical protein